MESSGTTLNKAANLKGWRFLAFCISAILVLVTFHVYRMANPPDLVANFARSWQECAQVPSAPGSCSWNPVFSPIAHSPGQPAADRGHYRRTFLTPSECERDGCSLLLENVKSIASLSLNGHFLTGSTAEHRSPIVQTLAAGALKPPGESNTLELMTTGGEPTFNMQLSTLGLVVTKSGQRYLAAYNFHNVFAPLAGAIYLLVIAALSAVCPVPGVRSMPIFRMTLNYCVLSAAFLFNLSATVQEVIPSYLSTPVHCILRFACDWCFATLVLSVYYVKSKWVPALHAIFGTTILFYVVLACSLTVFSQLGRDAMILNKIVHASVVGSCTLTLCGALIGLFHASATNKPALERVLSFVGFVTLFSLQVRDLLVNLDFEQGSYSSRTYPLFIGLVAAGVLIRRATLLHADERLASETNAAMSRVAGQVAHDIRSPLAALNMVTRNLSQIPEENRVLVREAATRINEIANSLTFKNMEGGKDDDKKTDILEISPLVDVIVTECQIRLTPGCTKSLKLDFEAANYGVFVSAQSAEVKRMLCNLINNGVEAIAPNGEVTVAVRPDGESVRLIVSDNGPGIPPHIRCQLGARGKTFGKKGGSGLGLYHAKTSMESWGGSLTISDGPSNRGVEVIAEFPRAPTPPWHLTDLLLTAKALVVVVDDDESIHEIWRHRFRSHGLSDLSLRVAHFDTVATLQSYARSNDVTNAIYLIDLEINGVPDAGITSIKDLGIEKKSVLVTSRADDIDVKDFCSAYGVKLLHKRMAEFLPIRGVQADARPVVVLIDDDELVHTVWRMAAKGANKKLISCRSRDEFLARAAGIPLSSPVYVDYNLSHDLKGDSVCRELLSLGYESVHIATGNDLDRVPPVSGIASVTGKDPPGHWLSSAVR